MVLLLLPLLLLLLLLLTIPPSWFLLATITIPSGGHFLVLYGFFLSAKHSNRVSTWFSAHIAASRSPETNIWIDIFALVRLNATEHYGDDILIECPMCSRPGLQRSAEERASDEEQWNEVPPYVACSTQALLEGKRAGSLSEQ